MKELNLIETNQFSLLVIECDCGFHIGLDFTWIDQVGDITIRCPVCYILIDTEKINGESNE